MDLDTEETFFDVSKLKIIGSSYGVAGQHEIWFEYEGAEYFCEFSWNNYEGYDFWFYDNSNDKNSIESPEFTYDPEFESEFDCAVDEFSGVE
jgi:hypothetical protein